MEELNVLFSANLTDDAVWNESGDLEIPPGREIAKLIVSSLQQLEIKCTKVIQRDYYGWEFHIKQHVCDIVAVLQRIEEWVLVLRAKRSALSATLDNPGGNDLREAANAIAQVLRGDKRISDVRVLTNDESPY